MKFDKTKFFIFAGPIPADRREREKRPAQVKKFDTGNERVLQERKDFSILIEEQYIKETTEEPGYV